MGYIGKIFIFIGLIFIAVGLIWLILSKFHFPFLGKLPGDILIHKKNFTFYFPLTSCILISLLLSLIFLLFSKK